MWGKRIDELLALFGIYAGGFNAWLSIMIMVGVGLIAIIGTMWVLGKRDFLERFLVFLAALIGAVMSALFALLGIIMSSHRELWGGPMIVAGVVIIGTIWGLGKRDSIGRFLAALIGAVLLVGGMLKILVRFLGAIVVVFVVGGMARGLQFYL